MWLTSRHSEADRHIDVSALTADREILSRYKAAQRKDKRKIDDVRSDEEISGRHKQYVDWWEKQGESTKQAVGRFVRLIRQSNKDRAASHKKLSEFGKSFMNWLMLNHSSYIS